MKIAKLRDSIRNAPCMRCGAPPGTAVLAHYFGPRRHSYGGGMGIKGHDVVGAALCTPCHVHMDTLSKSKVMRWEHSEEFLHYCALTFIWWINEGVLK